MRCFHRDFLVEILLFVCKNVFIRRIRDSEILISHSVVALAQFTSVTVTSQVSNSVHRLFLYSKHFKPLRRIGFVLFSLCFLKTKSFGKLWNALNIFICNPHLSRVKKDTKGRILICDWNLIDVQSVERKITLQYILLQWIDAATFNMFEESLTCMHFGGSKNRIRIGIDIPVNMNR